MASIQQAQIDGVVLGLRSASPTVLHRLDVDQLMTQQPDTFNLFILALDRIQRDQFSFDRMEWFQVSGIHGMPNTPWDNVTTKRTGSSFWNVGYCTHGQPHFPTWHRPYVAQIEQSIYQKMTEIAQEFVGEVDRYRAAASQFRLPFWDWFRPRGQYDTSFPGVTNGSTTTFPYDFKLPRILSVPQVMVNLPGDSVPQPLKNPLYSFNFPSDPNLKKSISVSGFSNNWTVRQPSQSIDKSDDDQVDQVLNMSREGLVDHLIDLLNVQDYKNWTLFSNHGSSNKYIAGSIEGIHDTIHGSVGGRGHMGVPPLAAFDPVFWLHHCNVDRVFAVWQGVNPQSWLPSSGPVNSQTPLFPFRSKAGNQSWWTSDLCRDINTLGYTYPDLEESTNSVDLRRAFTSRYAWSSQSKSVNDDFTPPDDMQVIDVSDSPFFNFPRAFAGPKFDLKANDTPQSITNGHDGSSVAQQQKQLQQQYLGPDAGATPANQPDGDWKAAREWFFDAEAGRNDFGGTFSVYVMIGPFEDNGHYDSQPTLAGMTNFFISPAELCDNCMDQGGRGEKVHNTVPITPILRDYVKNGQLESLHPSHVKSFLVKNLRWRIVKRTAVPGTQETLPASRPVPRNEIPASFKVRINTGLTYIDRQTYDVEYGPSQDCADVVNSIVHS